MGGDVNIINHSGKIKQMVEQNKKAALRAMGDRAVGLITQQMQTGYGKSIRDTGDLMRDVSFQVERSGAGTVDVGNTLKYATVIHEGTHKTAARPYIRDGIQNGIDQLQKVAEQEMKKGL